MSMSSSCNSDRHRKSEVDIEGRRKQVSHGIHTQTVVLCVASEISIHDILVDDFYNI